MSSSVGVCLCVCSNCLHKQVNTIKHVAAIQIAAVGYLCVCLYVCGWACICVYIICMSLCLFLCVRLWNIKVNGCFISVYNGAESQKGATFSHL